VPLVREVPPRSSSAGRRPRAGRRTSTPVISAHVHALFFERLDLMLSEPEPFIGGYQPGEQDADDMLLRMDLEESLARFVADRARLVTRLRSLTDADWARSARHGEYRAYSVFIMFRHVALHDFLHAYRIEELLLRPDWDDGIATADATA
jgi:hypothetical protein